MRLDQTQRCQDRRPPRQEPEHFFNFNLFNNQLAPNNPLRRVLRQARNPLCNHSLLKHGHDGKLKTFSMKSSACAETLPTVLESCFVTVTMMNLRVMPTKKIRSGKCFHGVKTTQNPCGRTLSLGATSSHLFFPHWLKIPVGGGWEGVWWTRLLLPTVWVLFC